MCDAKAIFTHVYAGHVGSVHDQHVFRLSEVNDFLRSPDEYFPNDTHLIADAAYKLDPHLMAPYKDNGHLTQHQNNFNHYLSKARMSIERAFGLLKARWRSLLHLLPVTSIDKIPQYVVACCVLHNICELRGDVYNEPLPEILPEERAIRGPDNDIARNRAANTKRDRIALSLPPVQR